MDVAEIMVVLVILVSAALFIALTIGVTGPLGSLDIPGWFETKQTNPLEFTDVRTDPSFPVAGEAATMKWLLVNTRSSSILKNISVKLFIDNSKVYEEKLAGLKRSKLMTRELGSYGEGYHTVRLEAEIPDMNVSPVNHSKKIIWQSKELARSGLASKIETTVKERYEEIEDEDWYHIFRFAVKAEEEAFNLCLDYYVEKKVSLPVLRQCIEIVDWGVEDAIEDTSSCKSINSDLKEYGSVVRDMGYDGRNHIDSVDNVNDAWYELDVDPLDNYEPGGAWKRMWADDLTDKVQEILMDAMDKMWINMIAMC